MGEEILDAALRYAEAGWRVVPLHARDKRPHPKAWQKAATCDEEVITDWWDRWPDANLGVALGRDSGIIDIECDSPAAEKLYIELWGGNPPVTPTYEGSRGKHRLFKWSVDLPHADKAVFKIGLENALEFRTGNGDLGAQSVFPPSIHPTGAVYTWLVSPDECDIAELDAEFFARLSVYTSEGTLEAPAEGYSRKPKEHWEKIAQGVSDGYRREAGASYIGKLLGGLADPFDKSMIAAIWELIVAWNERNTPPWTKEKLRQNFDSILSRHQRSWTLKQARIYGEISGIPAAVIFVRDHLDGHQNLDDRSMLNDVWKSLIAWNKVNRSPLSEEDLRKHFDDVLSEKRKHRAANAEPHVREYVARQVDNLADPDDRSSLNSAWKLSARFNKSNGSPLTKEDLRTLFNEQLSERKRAQAISDSGIEAEGHTPGNSTGNNPGWHLVKMLSNPVKWRLFSPLWSKKKVPGGYVELLTSELLSFSKLRERIVEDTSVEIRANFKRPWEGYHDKVVGQWVPGIREQLLETHTVQECAPEENRELVVAEMLWQVLSAAKLGDDPDPRGAPRLLADNSTWFKVNYLLSDLKTRFNAEPPTSLELSKILTLVKAEDKQQKIDDGRDSEPRNHRFKRLSVAGLERLEKMALHGAQMADPVRRPLVKQVTQREPGDEDGLLFSENEDAA